VLGGRGLMMLLERDSREGPRRGLAVKISLERKDGTKCFPTPGRLTFEGMPCLLNSSERPMPLD
jgi:hypothetical protein